MTTSIAASDVLRTSVVYLKRAADLTVACALLAFTLPLLMVVAFAIKLDSPGPVFYRQERVGLGGRRFTLLKLRSMRQDAEADGRPVWAAAQDGRITRVGRFIRCMRIDELPQLFNVLRGEMSMVGPRPERPHFVDQLGAIIPSYHDRHTVLPGITGWAQINYPYGASIEDAREKLRYDLDYIANHRPLLDLKILVATVAVVVWRKGAR
jgi:exopolysaccharide biosynthesis polyprenyl glycosylphosphotransferase